MKKKQPQNTLYLIDTNVLLFDPQALEHFPDATVIVPFEVIEDLDRFKHGTDETSRNARNAAAVFDKLRSKGSLRDGVKLENGSVVQVGRFGKLRRTPLQPGPS